MGIIFAILVVVALQGCADEVECVEGETRCHGDEVQVCSSDRRWVTAMSCTATTSFSPGVEQWVCEPARQLSDDGAEEVIHACLPES